MSRAFVLVNVNLEEGDEYASSSMAVADEPDKLQRYAQKVEDELAEEEERESPKLEWAGWAEAPNFLLVATVNEAEQYEISRIKVVD